MEHGSGGLGGAGAEIIGGLHGTIARFFEVESMASMRIGDANWVAAAYGSLGDGLQRHVEHLAWPLSTRPSNGDEIPDDSTAYSAYSPLTAKFGLCPVEIAPF